MTAIPDIARTLGNATAHLDSSGTGLTPELSEALLCLLATIAETGHHPMPSPEDPPSNCHSCGGTGVRYLGVGANGHEWSDESCCCSHTHCACGACGFPCELASYAVDVASALGVTTVERPMPELGGGL